MTIEKTDIELVEAFKKGCEDSFVAIVQRYTEKVHNLSMRLTRNQEDAEEVLQDVFVTVYNKIHSFEGKSAFSSWLYRVTANTAFMKLRSRKNKETVSLEDVEPTVKNSLASRDSINGDETYLTIRHELREVLQGAINKLPHEYKTIFILRDVDGLSNQEVGGLLNMSVPAIKSRLHRARLLLRKKLQRYYDDYTKSDFISFGKEYPSQGVELH